MSRTVLILAVVIAALCGVEKASAGLATMSVSDIPLHSDRTMQAVSSPAGFDYVGLHWRGQGRVWFRVRAQGHAWGPWHRAEQSDGPDPGTAEARRTPGWIEGDGVWVGRRRALQVRATAGVERVRAYTIRSLVSRVPLRIPRRSG